MRPLTDRQREILTWVNETDPPRSAREASDHFGISHKLIYQTLRKARLNAGEGELPVNLPDPHLRGAQATDPEAFWKAFDMLAEPASARKPMDAIAEACGLTSSAVKTIWRDMQTRYVLAAGHLRAIKTDDLAIKFENLTDKILDSVRDIDLVEASLLQKVTAAAIATDKSRLLRSQPTEIVRIEERQAMEQLLPELMRELERRHLVVDVNPETGKVEIPDTIHLVPR